MVFLGQFDCARGDVVLARAVGLDDGAHDLLGHVGEIGQELLGVLGQAVAAVAEGGVVVVVADAPIQPHTADDLGRVQPALLGVGVQFIEVGHAHGQIGVGEELDGFGLGRAHHERGYRIRVLVGGFGQHGGKTARSLHEGVVVEGHAHDDAARVQVVVKRAPLAQKLGGEDDGQVRVALGDAFRVPDGHRGLDDDCAARALGGDVVEYALDASRVEEVFFAVVVCGRRDDDVVGVRVGAGRVRRGGQVECVAGQKGLDFGIADGTFARVDQLHLFGYEVDGVYMVALPQ